MEEANYQTIGPLF